MREWETEREESCERDLAKWWNWALGKRNMSGLQRRQNVLIISKTISFQLNDRVSKSWNPSPRYRVLDWLQFWCQNLHKKNSRTNPIARTFVLPIGFQLGSNFWCQNLHWENFRANPTTRTFVLPIGFQLGSNFWCQNFLQVIFPRTL